MFKVESLIQKELQLDQNLADNNQAVNDLMCLLAEFSKKKSENIRYALFNHA